ALLNGLTVAENLLLPLRGGAYPTDAMRRKVRLIMTQLRLDGLENLYPRELSGGVSRKVELARALIRQPEILIWDELLDGLDPFSVIEIQEHLAREIRTRQLTILFATHQAGRIPSFANRVAVLDHGTLLFDGALRDLSGHAQRNPDLKYSLKGWL
ncbi:MAG: ATP-binding cassette domain-containing protein, partial [Methylococcales bacterium]